MGVFWVLSAVCFVARVGGTLFYVGFVFLLVIFGVFFSIVGGLLYYA